MTDTNTEIKRFVAPSMTRALELVRDEMGPEAVILSSNKIDGGVEIVTSIERDLPTRGVAERRAFGQYFDTDNDQVMDSDASWETQAGIEKAAASYAGSIERNDITKPKASSGADIAHAIERARERMLEAKQKAAQGEAVGPEARNDSSPTTKKASQEQEQKMETLRGEIADLRMLLEEQMWRQPELLKQQAAHLSPADNKRSALQQHLSRLGLSSELIAELCMGAGDQLRLSESWKSSLAQLSQRIPIAKTMDIHQGGHFAFVGPTGVGKTTTLAKLAAQYTLTHGPGKVAIVSMDTHRVGAVEQLRALGRILDVPLRIVDEQNSLLTTLASLRHFPLVLIDTAGFRQGDEQLHMQLAHLDQTPSVRRLLVLSALSQAQTLKASIHAYRPRTIDACVLSKLDESSSLGEAISVVIEHQLGVAYLTDGQQIPQDIHNASAHKLVASAVELAKSNSLTHFASL